MMPLAVTGRLSPALIAVALVLACSSRPRPAPAPPVPAAPARAATLASTAADAGSSDDAALPAPFEQSAAEPAPYRGQHKLGVNRVTDMARIGSVSFARRDGVLTVEGRVARGSHWLALHGKVEPRGDRVFDLVGAIEGVPDMAWAGEPLRERRSEGRFRFEVRKGRPYFRLYEVNGRECVCQEDCGNDFCYIDIEVAEALP